MGDAALTPREPDAGSSSFTEGGAASSNPPRDAGSSNLGNEDRLLGPCLFVEGSDWRTADGTKLLVSCGEEIGLLPLDGTPFLTLTGTVPSLLQVGDIYLSATHLIYRQGSVLLSVPLQGGASKALALDVDLNVTVAPTEDRSQLVFSRPGASSSDPYTIFVVDSAGTAPARELTQGDTPQLSPDGTRVLFRSAIFTVSSISIQGGPVAKIGQPQSLDPICSSHDGTRLAFYDLEKSQLVVSRFDGATAVTVGPVTEWAWTPIEFTPDDGALLAKMFDPAYSGTKVALYPLDGTAALPISEGKGFTSYGFARSGSSLLSAQVKDNTSSPELWLWTTTNNRMLASLERCGELAVAVSPTRTRVAFIDVLGTFQVVDLESGTSLANVPNVASIGNTCVASPSWINDDEVLLGGCESCERAVRSASGTRVSAPGKGSFKEPEFSPTGRYGAWADNGDFDLYDLESGAPVFGGSGVFHFVDANRFVYTDSSEKSYGVHLLRLP
ncbi:MAG: hypothetical protein JWN04_6508 [Myxococcaceae bacterium]|nr:hypothetical protein [Myxococcaceae bacterium]